MPPDQRKKKGKPKIKVDLPEMSKKKWIPPDQRPKKKKEKPKVTLPPLSTRKWIPPDKRKKKKKSKPKIDYPPLTTRKWIPPYLRKRKKPGPKYIKPDGISQKLDPSSLLKVWHEFLIIDDYAILSGHYSQYHKKYGFLTNGYQGPCNVVVAIAVELLLSMKEWDEYILDKILDLGNALYSESMLYVEDKCNPWLKLADIYSSFYINNTKVTMTIKSEKYSGKLFDNFEGTPTLKEILGQFFNEHDSGILQAQKKHFGVWKQGN